MTRNAAKLTDPTVGTFTVIDLALLDESKTNPRGKTYDKAKLQELAEAPRPRRKERARGK